MLQGMDGETLAQLRRTRLFRGVAAPELSALLQKVNHRLLERPRGSLVLCRGDTYSCLHLLLQGTVSAEMEDQNGRVLKIESIAAPGVLASAILFAPEPRLPVNLRALNPVRLFVLPKAGLLLCCQRQASVLEALLLDMGGRAAFLAEKLRLTQFSSIRQKLASYLLERSDAQGRVRLALGRQALAEVFGVARPSLSRVFGEFARRGWVREQDGRALRVDRGALEQALHSAK